MGKLKAIAFFLAVVMVFMTIVLTVSKTNKYKSVVIDNPTCIGFDRDSDHKYPRSKKEYNGKLNHGPDIRGDKTTADKASSYLEHGDLLHAGFVKGFAGISATPDENFYEIMADAAKKERVINYGETLKWYKRAHKLGEPEATYRLGATYLTGFYDGKDHKATHKGLKRNLKTSLYYINQLANKNTKLDYFLENNFKYSYKRNGVSEIEQVSKARLCKLALGKSGDISLSLDTIKELQTSYLKYLEFRIFKISNTQREGIWLFLSIFAFLAGTLFSMFVFKGAKYISGSPAIIVNGTWFSSNDIVSFFSISYIFIFAGGFIYSLVVSIGSIGLIPQVLSNHMTVEILKYLIS